jgi:hypothetical protein
MARNGQLKQTVNTTVTSAVQIIAGNSSRNYLWIGNVGSNDLTIGFDSTLTAGNGMVLSPGNPGKQGGSFVWQEPFIPTNPIWAAASTATTIVIMEG